MGGSGTSHRGVAIGDWPPAIRGFNFDSKARLSSSSDPLSQSFLVSPMADRQSPMADPQSYRWYTARHPAASVTLTD